MAAVFKITEQWWNVVESNRLSCNDSHLSCNDSHLQVDFSLKGDGNEVCLHFNDNDRDNNDYRHHHNCG